MSESETLLIGLIIRLNLLFFADKESIIVCKINKENGSNMETIFQMSINFMYPVFGTLQNKT